MGFRGKVLGYGVTASEAMILGFWVISQISRVQCCWVIGLSHRFKSLVLGFGLCHMTMAKLLNGSQFGAKFG